VPLSRTHRTATRWRRATASSARSTPGRGRGAVERARPEVVGLPRVRALLGAGGHQPHVAAHARGGAEGARERDEAADAGRVVVGARRRGHGVGVGHQDAQAALLAVADPQDVARGAVAGDGEAVVADLQAGGAEAALHPGVRAALGGGARRPRPGQREGAREGVRLGGRRCARR
jgi:hypothetical protein